MNGGMVHAWVEGTWDEYGRLLDDKTTFGHHARGLLAIHPYYPS